MCYPYEIAVVVLAVSAMPRAAACSAFQPAPTAQSIGTRSPAVHASQANRPTRRPAIMTSPLVSLPVEPTALAACRNPRNCVVDSPDAADPARRPIAFRAPIEEVMRILTASIADESRTRIVVQGRRYLRAEARSALFRFVDDVELLADENAGLIHFRSASRIGFGDLGVNGRRMRRVTARIRQRLADLSGSAP